MGCLSHDQRKFDEALKALVSTDREGSGPWQSNRLFAIEKSLANLAPEDRLKKRQELARPVLDEFLSWLKSQRLVKGAFGKAVHYTLERPFAVALDNDPDVKMFFKIPDKFKIETPIGTYNPDWAVYMDKDGVERLYFVLETKGTTRIYDLRTPEQQKIHCGERHFAALADGVELRVVRNWREFKVGI